jgi:hypothetical protein
MRLPQRGPLLAALALLAAAGCETFRAQTPAGFVALEDPKRRYDYRATTHDGVVLGVRAMANEPRGDEGFWAQAVTERLRQQGGYALLETRPVKTDSGLTGRQLRFGHDQGARPHLYQVTLFVTRKRIYLLEAGGARPLMEREAARVDGFVTHFEPRRCWFGGCAVLAAP